MDRQIIRKPPLVLRTGQAPQVNQFVRIVLPIGHPSNPFSHAIIHQPNRPVNQTVRAVVVPQRHPMNPSPRATNPPARATNPSVHVVNQFVNAAKPNAPALNRTSHAVNQSASIRYPTGPVRYVSLPLRGNLQQRPSPSNASSVRSVNRPNRVVVAANCSTPNRGSSSQAHHPVGRPPGNASQDGQVPQEHILPQGNPLANRFILSPAQVRAQYRMRSFDISPEIIPRLRGAPPFFLGSPSYQKAYDNIKFQIIISSTGTPLPDGVVNFIDNFSDRDLLNAAAQFVYSIYDANLVDLHIPLRFDPVTRMLVLTDTPAPTVQSVLVRNNGNSLQHGQMHSSRVMAAASNGALRVAPAIIKQQQRTASAAAAAAVPFNGNATRQPPIQENRIEVAEPLSEQEQEAGPSDLSQRKTAATPQATDQARQMKRLAESDLPVTDGPRESKQAKVAGSTLSLQMSPQESVQIVARTSQQDEPTIGDQQEQAGTSSALERSKQKQSSKATANPTSQANRQTKFQANAIAPTAPVSTATDSVASTSSGTSKRTNEAKLSVSTFSNQTDTSESQSVSSESPSMQESTNNGTPVRYSKRPLKPHVPFLPSLESSYVKKKKPNDCPSRAAPPVSDAEDAKDEHCWKCHDAKKAELRHCSRCSLGWHTARGCSNTFFEPNKLKSMIMIVPGRIIRNMEIWKPERREVYEEKQAWIRTLSSVVDPTVCIECARKEAGAYYNKQCGSLKDFEETGDRSILERCAAMYEYAVKSLLMEIGLIFERIHYGKHKGMDQIDLEWMLEKAQTIDAYQCTEDFMFDIKKICHSYMILQQKQHGIKPGSPKYWTFKDQCKRLIGSARTEMDFINRCESCYRNHYEVNTAQVSSDMVMPCENPHALVWTVHCHLWWPAKVYEYREHQYFFSSEKYVYVVPFGDESEVKWTSYKLVRSLSKNAPEPSAEMLENFDKYDLLKQVVVRANLKKALSDAKQYYHKYWNEYFTEAYPLPDSDGPITLDDLYLKVELKPKKSTLDHNFILGDADSADDDKEEEEEETEQTEPFPVRGRVGRPRKSKKRKTTPSTQKASTSRVEAVAGPSSGDRGANSS